MIHDGKYELDIFPEPNSWEEHGELWARVRIRDGATHSMYVALNPDQLVLVRDFIDGMLKGPIK